MVIGILWCVQRRGVSFYLYHEPVSVSVSSQTNTGEVSHEYATSRIQASHSCTLSYQRTTHLVSCPGCHCHDHALLRVVCTALCRAPGLACLWPHGAELRLNLVGREFDRRSVLGLRQPV